MDFDPLSSVSPMGTEQRDHVATDIGVFKHHPLDHTRDSIRLLKISPKLTPDGLIQCTMTHSTIEHTTFNCLSYRWGPPLPSHDVLLNGWRHPVGDNLFEFLDTFRRSISNIVPEYLWIDALCIAQGNIQERNHQVTQMGKIFSTARVVYVWLGKMAAIEPIIRSLKNWQNPSSADFKSVTSKLLTSYLYKNEYWSRAWITQEFLLSQRIVMFLNEEVCDMSTLLAAIRSYHLLPNPHLNSSFFFRHISDKYSHSDDLKGRSLVSLLHQFRDKSCSIPRDRIFSLLALCSPPSRVEVNYTEDPLNLLQNIIANHPHPVCICDIMLLLRTLDLTKSFSPARKAFNKLAWETNPCCIEIDMSGIQIWEVPKPGAPATEMGDFLCLYGGEICPVIRETIKYAVMDVDEASWHVSQARSPPRDGSLGKLPYFYRLLPEPMARMLNSTNGKDWAVTTSDRDARTCTVRLSLSSVLRMPLPNVLCPVSKRCATWQCTLPEKQKRNPKYRYSKAGIHEANRNFEFDNTPWNYDLSEFISPKNCRRVFVILAQSDDIPKAWLRDRECSTVLKDLLAYFRGQSTVIPASKLRRAIDRNTNAQSGLTCKSGPCRFVSLSKDYGL